MTDIFRAVQHIDAACALIRAGYCLGANAKDGNNRACPVMSPEAVAWSLYGALLRATGGDDFKCQTSTAFELVVQVLRDFHQLRPHEVGWAGAIVLYEKAQVVERGVGDAITSRGRTSADAMSLLTRARARADRRMTHA